MRLLRWLSPELRRPNVLVIWVCQRNPLATDRLIADLKVPPADAPAGGQTPNT